MGRRTNPKCKKERNDLYMTGREKRTISDALCMYAQSIEVKANNAMMAENYDKEAKLRAEANNIRAVLFDWNKNIVNEPCGTVRI